MIKILLVDNHEIMRTGLKFFINHLVAHSIIDEAWDGDSAIKKIKKTEYELIILDVNMLATDFLISNFGMNAKQIYAKRYLYLQPAATGYVSKGASAIELGNAINDVLKNDPEYKSLFPVSLMPGIKK